ncbi:glycosyltransferase [Amycolatopsis umgeniensis]|uniref:UDP:flavonoid glycosyltransferase YjiC (YdhE family) n=1 Tax=Amycolatopsis umgeniensis TaxID=336628 RepID=A0A841BAT1_9PSEU|nr:glycosyltransferase [Amycolatopsis umgeniensis]MBB5855624.1 UDP:flavonoid glycosyltransferase YjiC (YdhE family) [Amycolatopsis umgeniensis]
MRVLLSMFGTRGDLEPVLAMAVRLRERGVDVRVCGPANFVDRLAEFGVPMVPVGPPVRAGAGPGPGFADELIAAQFDQVPAVAEGCDAVVATGMVAVASAVRSVAEKLGIPYFYAACHPIDVRSPHDPQLRPDREGESFALDTTDQHSLRDMRDEGLFQRFGEPVNSRRAVLGLPPVDSIIDHAYTERPWLAADPVLVPLRPGQEAVQTGSWYLVDERPLPAELEEFLAAGEPPVYVGFGSLDAPDDAARVAIEAVRAQGRRVILSRGWAELARIDDQSDCLVIDEVNVQVLFGRVAAVVHHGGSGTAHVATRAGVPQVIIFQGMDQPYFAARVASLGIGVAHDGPTPTVESLSAALVTALAPETSARAEAVAEIARTDGAAAAAELLLDAVSREKPAVSV